MDYDFSAITPGQTDADSIISQMLMDALREDLYHLKEFCYGVTDPFTPIAKHTHDNVNSALVVLGDGQVVEANLGPNAVTVEKIKIASGSSSIGIGAGGSNAIATSAVALGIQLWASANYNDLRRCADSSDTYLEYVRVYNVGGANSFLVKWYYLSASEPHIVIYYDERNGEIVGVWESEQNDFPIYDLRGNEIDPILFDLALPDTQYYKRLNVQKTHELIKDKSIKVEEAAIEGKIYAAKIRDDLVIDKDTQEIKDKPVK